MNPQNMGVIRRLQGRGLYRLHRDSVMMIQSLAIRRLSVFCRALRMRIRP